MTTTIALIGAGGKMGCRIIDHLQTNPAYRLCCVEVSEPGKANLAQRRIQAVPSDQALADAEVVILALPDRVLGKVAREVVPKVKPGRLISAIERITGAPFARSCWKGAPANTSISANCGRFHVNATNATT